MRIMEIDFEKLKGALWGKQPAVATKLGVHPNTLNRKINQKRRLTIDDLNKIAMALRRDTSDFIMEIEVEDEEAKVIGKLQYAKSRPPGK